MDLWWYNTKVKNATLQENGSPLMAGGWDLGELIKVKKERVNAKCKVAQAEKFNDLHYYLDFRWGKDVYWQAKVQVVEHGHRINPVNEDPIIMTMGMR